MTDWATKVKTIGLTQVYCTKEKPLVDIVFVHGLNGHPYNTWSTKEPPVFWPADLLPNLLEPCKVRILTYGYNANVTAFTDGASKDHIHQHAETLASTLAANRNLRQCPDRPIIFVCHSLGGLVVKRALIYCRSVSNEKIEHLRSIFVSTYGILFLGTPHNGSDVAKWGVLLQNICSAVLPKKFMESSPQLIKALRTNNETLQNINSLFADIMGRFHLYFFHETRSTDVKGTRELIVDESSAAPYFEGVERMGIEADHSHMCKFADEDAPGFEAVAEALLRYSRDAPLTIFDRWVEEEKTRLVIRQTKAKEIFNNENISPSSSMHNVATPENPANRPALKGGGGEPPDPGPSNSTTQLALSRSSLRDPLFVVPAGFHPNATFVGMTRELDILHARLYRAKKRAERLAAVLICGGPGAGKSHLARQYVWTQRDCYPGGIFWVDAKSRESTSKCFWDIAQAASLTDDLEFESPDFKAPQKYVEVVRNWFQAREEWLLVFDGLSFNQEDDLNHFRQFLPFNRQCSIIYTSVDRTLRKKQRLYEPYCLQVPPLSVEDACKLLFKDLGIKRPTKEQVRKAAELVMHYECLPLAIHAISHRLSATSKPIERYHINSHLTDEKLAEPFLSIMHDLYRMAHFEALNLINLLSFFGHHVPLGLINLGRSVLETWNVEILTSSRPGERGDIDTTLGILIRYGLIERTSDAYVLKDLSPQSEKELIFDPRAVVPELSESQTESSSQEASFSIYQHAGSIDVIKIHSVVQGFCRDELKIMDEEQRKQSSRLEARRGSGAGSVHESGSGSGVVKAEAGFYESWLVVAIRLLCKSYENAKKRMELVDDYGLVKDYREYETHASRLIENFPKRASKEKIVQEARNELKQLMRSISSEIERLSPHSSQDSIRKHRSVFDRSSSSSSSVPDSDGSPSRQLTWDLGDESAKVESPKELPATAHLFNLSPFLPHIFRESSSEQEAERANQEKMEASSLSQMSQATEKPLIASSPPRDDQGWQVVEKPQKPKPGKERQPKQRPKFSTYIHGSKPAAPVLKVFPVEGRSASSSSMEKGRSSSSVSATEALTSVQSASPRRSEEDLPAGQANRTWAAVVAKAKRAAEARGAPSLSPKQRPSSSPGETKRPSLPVPKPLESKSSGETLGADKTQLRFQEDRLSRSTYSEPGPELLTQQLHALDLGIAPDSHYHYRQLSTSMTAAPLRDMSASTPSILAFPPQPLPYENDIEITVSRRLNASNMPPPPPVSQSAATFGPIPPFQATHHSITHPSAILPGASPPVSIITDGIGNTGYTSDPPPALEPLSRGPSGQSYQSWSPEPEPEPMRLPPRLVPLPTNSVVYMPQQQTLSGAGGWISDAQQPASLGSVGSPEDPGILHFGAHRVDVRDARQRLEVGGRYQVSGASWQLYHSNRSGPLIRPSQDALTGAATQGTYVRRPRSGSSPIHP
ncbi:protein SERAC1 [Aspergillus udagawae]|nr:protein SERAC1 [Aspergillus udagawae]GFG09848.1 protein SERAC1 [Aspergillus udagawae]